MPFDHPIDPALAAQLFDAAPDAVVVVDDEGVIRLANAQATALLGWRPEALVGRPVEVLLPGDLKDRHRGHRERFAENPSKRPMGLGVDLVAVRADGSEVPVDISLSPLVHGDRRLVAAAMRDATERRRAEAELMESEERLRTSLESMLDGFAVFRTRRSGTGAIEDFCWSYVNATGAVAFERSPDELEGTTMTETVPGARSSGFLDGLRRVVETDTPWSSSGMRLRRDPDAPVYEFRAWRLGDGVAITWRDVTERERAAAELRRSEERFRGSVEHLHEALSVFTAIRDEDGRIVDFRWDYGNAQAGVATGRPAEDLVGRTLLEVLPAHAPSGLLDRYREVVETGEPWAEEGVWFEDTWGDGTRARRAFDIHATKLHDGFVVVSRDVTDRREQVVRLERRHAELERTNTEIRQLNELGDLLQSCVTADEAYAVAARSMGTLLPDCSGAFSALTPEGGNLRVAASWGPAVSGPRTFAPSDCWALRRGQAHVSGPDAPRCPHLPASVEACLCIPMVGQGEAIGVLHVHGCDAARAGDPLAFADATSPLATTVARQLAMAVANIRLRDRLRDLSIRDPLTGLFNRRYMEETLTRELARGARTLAPVALCQVDIDHFKDYNDAHGHAAGDAVLVAVAEAIAGAFRASDVVCRYGGEEFVVILPECDAASAHEQMERVRERVSALAVVHAGEVLPSPTVSCGVAAAPQDATSAADLLRRADAALYAAKDAGRDVVVRASVGD